MNNKLSNKPLQFNGKLSRLSTVQVCLSPWYNDNWILTDTTRTIGQISDPTEIPEMEIQEKTREISPVFSILEKLYHDIVKEYMEEIQDIRLFGGFEV